MSRSTKSFTKAFQSSICITGKRDLPAQLRQRFTELYVPEMTNRGDLQQLVLSYLRDSTQDPPVDAIIDFYLASRTEAVSWFPSAFIEHRPGAFLYL